MSVLEWFSVVGFGLSCFTVLLLTVVYEILPAFGIVPKPFLYVCKTFRYVWTKYIKGDVLGIDERKEL